MSLKNHLDPILTGMNKSVILLDGFDGAFVGLVEGDEDMIAVYDEDECISILIKQGLSFDDAKCHFLINVQGSCYSKSHPIFINTLKNLI